MSCVWKSCNPYDSSDRLRDLCVRKLRGGCTQVDRMNANRTLDRAYGLRRCMATVTTTTHKECPRPDLVCQVLYPSESDPFPVQPFIRSTQLASVFVYDLLWFQPKPRVPIQVRSQECDNSPASTGRSTILRTPRNPHHAPLPAF